MHENENYDPLDFKPISNAGLIKLYIFFIFMFYIYIKYVYVYINKKIILKYLVVY